MRKLLASLFSVCHLKLALENHPWSLKVYYLLN